MDWCFILTLKPPVVYKAGQFYFGGDQKGVADSSGWIHRVDGDSGNVLWKYHAEAPVVAGVTPTAGGVVFSGDLAGNFFALDAKTGFRRRPARPGSSS